MIDEKNYTSLILSKKLIKNGCELESGIVWGNYAEGVRRYKLIKSKFNLTDYKSQYKGFIYHTAYNILNDICCKYAKEFFGEKLIMDELHIRMAKELIDDVPLAEPAYIYYPREILKAMQEGKKLEVEDYIWNHCLFNKAKNND